MRKCQKCGESKHMSEFKPYYNGRKSSCYSCTGEKKPLVAEKWGHRTCSVGDYEDRLV